MLKYLLPCLFFLMAYTGDAAAQKTAPPNPYGIKAREQYFKDQKALAKKKRKEERRKGIKKTPKKKVSKIDRMGGNDLNESFRENSKKHHPLFRRRK